MTGLPGLTGRELAKIVEKFGFTYNHTKGSHLVYKHSDGRRVTIPAHSGEEIGIGLLTKIIKKDLQVSREEFLQHAR